MAAAASPNGVSRNQLDAFLIKLAHHESQLESLDSRFGSMKRTLASVASDVKNLANIVVADQARPAWDFNKALDNVVKGGALIAAAVAAIVYVSGNNFAVTMNAQATRVEAIAERSQLYHEDLKDQFSKTNQDWKERQANLRDRLIAVEKFLLEQTARRGGIGPETQRFIPSPDDWVAPSPRRLNRDERNL